MTSKYFKVTASVEADSPSVAAGKLQHAFGMVPEIARYSMDGIENAPSPWMPAKSAPKDGKPFIGFDANINSAFTVEWHVDDGKFIDVDRNIALFTHWMHQPSI